MFENDEIGQRHKIGEIDEKDKIVEFDEIVELDEIAFESKWKIITFKIWNTLKPHFPSSSRFGIIPSGT